MLNPSLLSQGILMYQKNDLISLKDEYMNWINNLIEIQPFFKTYKKYSSNLFDEILLPLL